MTQGSTNQMIHYRPQSVDIFYSYARADSPHLKNLITAIAPLRRSGLIGQDFYDEKILPGNDYREDIKKYLNRSHLVLLLVSAKFFSSDYCYEIELPLALERMNKGEARVIPIIIKACDWNHEILPTGRFNVLPESGKPVTDTTAWPEEDAAWTNVVQGIRKVAEEITSNGLYRAPADIDLYQDSRRAEEYRAFRGDNPYLLVPTSDDEDGFRGRKKELRDLDEWFNDPNIRPKPLLCLSNLGGTGKSALVWRWFENEQTLAKLVSQRRYRFWTTFYARNYDYHAFIRSLAETLGMVRAFSRSIFEDHTSKKTEQLADLIIERMREEPWLLVIDGLEREMGAFKNPDHFLIDSEEQDKRNELNRIPSSDQRIRSITLSNFLHQLSETKAKVLITTRIFPEELKGVAEDYPFGPMSMEDASSLWQVWCEDASSKMLKDFFRLIDYHPQVISVVAATVKQSKLAFEEWFEEFQDDERQKCLDEKVTKTERRHRWLELATSDLKEKFGRHAWLTLCYIVSRSEASDFNDLVAALVRDQSDGEQGIRGRFRDRKALNQVLSELQERRLLGYNEERELIDIHPVIRGMVMDYILGQFVTEGECDKDLFDLINSTGDLNDLLIRFIANPDYEKESVALERIFEKIGEEVPGAQGMRLNLLRRLYSRNASLEDAWMVGLPEIRYRREQAIILKKTAQELVVRGLSDDWQQSEVVLRRAMAAFRLVGDEEEVEQCLQSHDWQSLYGGRIRKTEFRLLREIVGRNNSFSKVQVYWLALVLAIRQARPIVEELLSKLEQEASSRWELQTLAESWYYLDNNQKAVELAQKALSSNEKVVTTQILWEKLTRGLALVRLAETPDQFDAAKSDLDETYEMGAGIGYNVITMFALSGKMEMELRSVDKFPVLPIEISQKIKSLYRRYIESDPNTRHTLPASEARLTLALINYKLSNHKDALEYAKQSIRIASGDKPRFGYWSVIQRVCRGFDLELPETTKTIEEEDHEIELNRWVRCFVEKDGMKEI
jgi:tetratricopeptide (TPR) repeat protein